MSRNELTRLSISLDEALDYVYSLASSKLEHTPDSVLQDFAGILSYMADENGQLVVSELLNAIENLRMALEDGDVTLLSQPRGLRTPRIVNVDEFVESKFFMGQRGYVRPKVLEKLWELFHGENAENHLEVVLGGGIGWGKSFFGEMALGYMLYKLSCYYNPQVEYGLAPGSSIYFVMQSIKEDLAKKVLFGQFSQRLKRSEYFCRYFPYDTKISSELRFPQNVIVLPLSSTDTSALGLNVFGGILDELNFMARVSKASTSRTSGEHEYDQAAKLHSTVIRRMKSRFSVKGRVPGKLLLISSANYPGDFIDRKIKESQDDIAKNGKSDIFVVRMAQWEALPKDRFSEGTFLVEVGDETRSSRMVTSREEAADPEAVIEIPVDYKKDFESDLEASLRDLAGIPIGGVSAFIKRRESIEQAAKAHSALFEGHQLFRLSQLDLSHFNGELSDLLDESYLSTFGLREIPAFYASVDLALSSDSCGIAIGHFSGYRAVGTTTNWDEGSGRYISSQAGEEPEIVIDGLLEIMPPKVDEIDISRVGDIIEMINARLPLEIVTADSFQSAYLLQRIRKLRNRLGRRIRSGVLSVDRTIAPYSEVKQALRDSRLFFPDVLKVKKELRELILDPIRLKIDHPVGGSKDISDAMAAVTYIAARRNSRKSLAGSAGRALLAGIDVPYEETEVKKHVRPKGSGHRLHS